MASEDKRKYKRLDATARVELSYVDSATGTARLDPETLSKNLSAGGLLVSHDRALPVGSEVALKFCLPDKQDLILALARVVRVEEISTNKYDIGLSYVEPLKQDIGLLYRLADTVADDEPKQRKHPRMNVDVKVEFAYVDPKTKAPTLTATPVSQNISAGGLLVRHNAALPVGANVSVTFRFPPNNKMALSFARVVRVVTLEEHKLYDIGLQLDNTNAEDLERIRDHLAEHASQWQRPRYHRLDSGVSVEVAYVETTNEEGTPALEKPSPKLGPHGLLISHEQPLVVGKDVVIKFLPPSSDHAVIAFARVVSADLLENTDEYEIGLRFFEADATNFARIEDLGLVQE